MTGPGDYALGQVIGEPGKYFICIDDRRPGVFAGPYFSPPCDDDMRRAAVRATQIADRMIVELAAGS